IPAAEDHLMRAETLAGAVVVVAFGLLVVVLLVLSLPWPLIQDAPVMHYIAWRIGEGDVPYRDLYDINQPGVYVLHLALLRTLGAGDGAWRAFDLAWLAATAGAVALLAARWGAVAAAGAALAFAAYHLAGGAWQAGQRDFLMCVFLVVGALGVVRWLERRGAAWSLAGAGLALGAAVGLAYGVAHYIGQSKGSEYHLYPLATFVCVLAFSALTPARAAQQRARLGVPLAVTLPVALVLLTAKGLEAADAPYIWDKERRVRILADDLGRSLAPGDTVQVLDIADGGLHALLRL